MKKIYLSFLFFILFFISIAQPTTERYWVGTSGALMADFTSASNWALISGGVPGASYAPGGSVEVNYIFDIPGTYNISTTGQVTSMGFITVKTGVTLNFDYNANTMTSTSQAFQGINIAQGGLLKISNKNMVFAAYTWAFTATPGYPSTLNGELVLEATTNQITFGSGSFQPMLTIGSTGVLRLNGNATSGVNALLSTNPSTLTVNNGGSIYINNNGTTSFTGNFDANSTIYIQGSNQTTSNINRLSGSIAAGNVVVNVPNSTTGFPIFGTGGPARIKGNLTIKNTGTKFCSNTNAASGSVNIIDGNLLLSNEGGTTTPTFQYFTSLSTNGTNSFLTINGNLETQTGTILDLGGNVNGTSTGNLNLKGNITLNGTTIETGGNAGNSGYAFVLNGIGTQILSSAGAQLNDIKFEIRKPAGVVNLTSNFVTSSSVKARFMFYDGKMNALGNTLTINNGDVSVALAGNINAYLYNGTLIWKTSSNLVNYEFPVGNETDYFPVRIRPTANNTDFSVRFYKPNTFLPLTGPAGINIISDYYWDIQVPSGTASANTISLGYTSLLAGILDYNLVKVAHYNSSTTSWDNLGGVPHTPYFADCPNSNTCGFINNVTSPITTFSPFTLAGPATTLSLKIENFNAVKQFNGASLNWQVAANNTAAKFELLKSIDDVLYNNLTTVDAITNKTNYNYLDVNLINGANYYKLKSTAQNGAISFSNVAIINHQIKGFAITSLVPTLIKNNALLSIASFKATQTNIIITSLDGKMVYNKTIVLNAGNNNINLNTLHFVEGIYQLKAINANGEASVIRFIKQ